MAELRRIAVFCGSSPGGSESYAEAARDLGLALVERNLELVYGGGNVGLMGVVADAVLAAGGHVIGVIPQGLKIREVAHEGLPDLRLVSSMHERKALMADLADGFIALPGGLGTLEEIGEILTWAQLGIHQKPCGFLNCQGFFDPLLAFLDHAVEERFLKPKHRNLAMVDGDPRRLLDRFALYSPLFEEKWLDRSKR